MKSYTFQAFKPVMFTLITIVSIFLVVPAAKSQVTEDDLMNERQKRVLEWFDTYTKGYNLSKPALETLRSEHAEFYGTFGDVLVAIDAMGKFAEAKDWETAEAIMLAVEGKMLEKYMPRLNAYLGWFAWAKTGMELFKTFVFDPALMSSAVETYSKNRDAGFEPADAVINIRAWGNVEQQLLGKFREEYGDAIFSNTDPSGLVLIPRWRTNFDIFVQAYLENEHLNLKLEEAKKEALQEKAIQEQQKSQYERQIILWLEEFANRVETLSISPSEATLEIGESVEFIVTGITYAGETKDLTEAALPSHLFLAETAGNVEVVARIDGLESVAMITVKGSEEKKTVSITILPSEITLGMGESVSFSIIAVFEDGTTLDVTTNSLTNWIEGSDTFTAEEEGSHHVSVSYNGLYAEAVVTVEEINRECDPVSELWNTESMRCECNTDNGYEFNGQLGRCISLDDAIDELSEDEELLCNEENLARKLSRLEGIVASGNRSVSDLHTLQLNFNKVINNQYADPCTNGVVAYSFASATQISADYSVMAEEVYDLGMDLILEGALCPLDQLELDAASILQRVSQAGDMMGQLERGIAGMENQLIIYGCDIQDVSDFGNTVADQTTNPEVLASGALGRPPEGSPDIPGNGGQNDGTIGFISVYYTGATFPQSPLRVSVQFNFRNFNFSVSPNIYEHQNFENASLREGENMRIQVQGTPLNPSINLFASDFLWIDRSTGTVSEPGTGSRVFSVLISVFFDDDEDEMRYRMIVVIGQGGFGYDGVPGGGRVLQF
jgi:hypothetical protein